MASRQGSAAKKSETSPSRRQREHSEAERTKSLNERRREKYQRDKEYRERLKAEQRERYRQENERPASAISDDLAADGVLRSIVYEVPTDDGDPTYVGPWIDESFTIREAADALSVTSVTLRSWINNGSFPAAIFGDTQYGYAQYVRGELEAAMKILADHSRYYKYLRSNHTETVKRIHDAVSAFRIQYLEDEGV